MRLTLLILLFPLIAVSQLYPDEQGTVLQELLVRDYKPSSVLTYGMARDTMYKNIYRNNDGNVTCSYTGHEVFLPDTVDPSTYLYNDGDELGITAEHIYPQSKGASDGNARSDMHSLTPVIFRANQGRSNYPYEEIPDNETDHWYLLATDLTQSPGKDKDLYSEQLNGGFGNIGAFEPRESVKGDIARAVFYFYTMYQEEADTADPDFFQDMKSTLLDWHYLDPTDSLELAITHQKAAYQNDLANPYILDCSLASRVFENTYIECNEFPTNLKTVIPSTTYVYPNPTYGFISIKGLEYGDTIEIRNLTGNTVFIVKNHYLNHLDVSFLDPGSYVLSISNEGALVDSMKFMKG